MVYKKFNFPKVYVKPKHIIVKYFVQYQIYHLNNCTFQNFFNATQYCKIYNKNFSSWLSTNRVENEIMSLKILPEYKFIYIKVILTEKQKKDINKKGIYLHSICKWSLFKWLDPKNFLNFFYKNRKNFIYKYR